MTVTTTADDRFLTVPQLIKRWPIGRTMVYQLIKSPDFPPALVLLRQTNGQPRSMGFRESDLLAYEAAHMVHASELDLEDEDATPEPSLPPAKRAMPHRRAR